MKTITTAISLTLREVLYLKHQTDRTPQEHMRDSVASLIQSERWPTYLPLSDLADGFERWDANEVRNNPGYIPMRLRYDEINALIDDPKATETELRSLIPESVAIGEQIRELLENTRMVAA